MAINFPDSPSLNDVFSSGGVDWKWDGTTWKGVAGTLPTASTTTLGGIKVGTNLSIAAGVLSASGGEVTVQDEGVSLSTAATTLNFTGNGVAATGTGATKTIQLGYSGGTGISLVGTTFNLNATTRDLTDVNNAALGAGDSGKVLTWSGTEWAGATSPVNFARTTASASTSSIANNVSANLDITGAAKAYGLLKIQTSVAAYVCLYTSQAARTQDANREITTDPNPGAGVIAEVMTSAGGTQIISPMLMGYNDEATPINTVYAKVINAHGSASVVTVTLHYIPFET